MILFLAFNVLDQQHDRVTGILKGSSQHDGYRVVFLDAPRGAPRDEGSSRRSLEQGISVIAGLAMIVAYAGLFLDKWGILSHISVWGMVFYPCALRERGSGGVAAGQDHMGLGVGSQPPNMVTDDWERDMNDATVFVLTL